VSGLPAEWIGKSFQAASTAHEAGTLAICQRHAITDQPFEGTQTTVVPKDACQDHYNTTFLAQPPGTSFTCELWLPSPPLHVAIMAVGVDTNRLIVGVTIHDGHAFDGDSANCMLVMPPKSVPRHAPKLDIPLPERNHPEAYFAEEREGWHGYIE